MKKKFNPEIVDYFVSLDPSGNNKYLDWLVKAMNSENTVNRVNHEIGGINSTEPTDETAKFLMQLVIRFHNVLPYMVYVENGVKVGTKDLYDYKVSDTDMISHLEHDIENAEERKRNKEGLKDAKKNSDLIYKDSNWLVVRPKTWEASCVYGSGTKWCTTSKHTDSHFDRETKRNFLIYVINKNLSADDNLYKVAWQIPFSKNVKKFLKNDGESNLIFDLYKIKLWDASDSNIVNKANIGEDYLDSVPKSVKATILKYMDNIMQEYYSNVGFSDDVKIMALIETFGFNEEVSSSIEQESWKHYGLDVYTVQELGEVFCVGYEYEMRYAKNIYVNDYIDDVGELSILNNMRNKEQYISISDAHYIALDSADNYIGDLSDEEILKNAEYSKYVEIYEILEKHKIHTTILETNREEIEEFMSRYGDLEKDEEEELEKLEKESDEIEKYLEKIFEDIKNKLRDKYYEDELSEMEDNPLRWLYNFGYLDRNDNILPEYENMVSIDRRQLVEDLIDDFDYSELGDGSNVHNIVINDETYYMIRIE